MAYFFSKLETASQSKPGFLPTSAQKYTLEDGGRTRTFQGSIENAGIKNFLIRNTLVLITVNNRKLLRRHEFLDFIILRFGLSVNSGTECYP